MDGASLLIEVVLEGLQLLIASADAAQPPGTYETGAVAKELYEGSLDAEQGHLARLVLEQRVGEYQYGVEHRGYERGQ